MNCDKCGATMNKINRNTMKCEACGATLKTDNVDKNTETDV